MTESDSPMADAALDSAAGTSAPRRRELTAQLSAPLRAFLATESGSAGLLAIVTVIALAWANSPWSDSYVTLFSTELAISVADWGLAFDLRHWIDEGLMGIFFFVIGMEVRREFSMGELTDRRQASVPIIAAIGGMVVPVLIYLAIVQSGAEANGWAIVIATDTAFVLGALALIGPRISTQLRIFLLTTAIVDDIVAISVIGLVYSSDVRVGPLIAAGCVLLLFPVLGWLDETRVAPYLILGATVWLLTVEAGVHATIAGMAAGLMVAAYPPRRRDVEVAARLTRAFRQSPIPDSAHRAGMKLAQSISPNERLQTVLHPWTSYVIVPLFALAYAGIDLRGGVLGDALAAPLTWAVVAGLVVGKTIGIALGTIATVKAGIGDMPRGVSMRQIMGGGALSGIGFTVSLLIAALAFESQRLQDQAMIGILIAAVLSPLVAAVIFRAAARRGDTTAALPLTLSEPFDPERDHHRGPADAPYVLVEYADFECPYCSLATGSVRELRERMGDELVYVFRHLPLEDVHPQAVLAAQVTEAAADQGRFWEMHDRLLAHQSELDADSLIVHATELGLDVEEILDDLDSGLMARQVREDVASAEASGASGTPTFFVNGRRVVGAYDSDTLERLLRERGPRAVDSAAGAADPA